MDIVNLCPNNAAQRTDYRSTNFAAPTLLGLSSVLDAVGLSVLIYDKSTDASFHQPTNGTLTIIELACFGMSCAFKLTGLWMYSYSRRDAKQNVIPHHGALYATNPSIDSDGMSSTEASLMNVSTGGHSTTTNPNSWNIQNANET